MTVETPTPITLARLQALPAFSDNYIWAIRSRDGNRCAVVDPGDAAVVRAWLAREDLHLVAILVTHHHFDHVGGIAALRGPGVTVYGPRHENIPGIDVQLAEGDLVAPEGLDLSLRVLDVPGHTAGHIAFFGELDGTPLLFCGDTLFSGGCGRLFEGTAAEMHESLQRLAALPPSTCVCCAHEYTLGNLRFAAAVEPGNADIETVTARARAQRARGEATLPGSIACELRINPFLRTAQASVAAAAAAHAGHALADPAAVFAALRRWKDGFH